MDPVCWGLTDFSESVGAVRLIPARHRHEYQGAFVEIRGKMRGFLDSAALRSE
jgi:hypothetical protein